MKPKLLITILVLAALFSGVVLWRVDRFVYGDRMAWAEAQARSQLSSVSQAINAEVQSARRMLNTVNNDSFKRETANWKAFQPYYALALMTSQGGSLAISRLVSKADSPAANWTINDLSQYLGFMGTELENRGAVLLRSFKDPQKKSHVAIIFAGGANAYILVGGGENLQALIESQKGSMSTFSIMARDGLTISHPTPDYIGNVMSDSTMLKEIRSTGAAHGLGTYRQGKKKIFGMYELVPRTNVYVMSTVPIAALTKGRLSLAWQFVFMLVGLGFIGAAIYFWQEKKNFEMAPVKATPASAEKKPVAPKAPQDTPTAPAVSIGVSTAVPAAGPGGDMLPPSPAALVSATPHELRAEKAEAYRQVASALGQEMRAPLASILGFSQMVLAKTQEPEVVQAVESILREARSSREVLENLVTFSGERTSEKTEMKIEGPIAQALKKLEAKIQQKGVKVEKDFKDTSPWPLAGTELTKVFENLFLNAIEAMERMQDKVLKISVWEEADGLHVRVSDTGEGIEMENLSKVFDPFFTTRSFAQHVGLGLPVVVGILKEHQAQIQIQSQRGKGTHVDLVFAPQKNSVVSPSASSLPQPLSPPVQKATELPRDLPKVAASSSPPPPSSSPSASVSKKEEKDSMPEESPKPVESSGPKLTEMNVDRLLEFQEDEMPLQFLEGQGFDEPPPPLSGPPSTPPPSVSPLSASPLARGPMPPPPPTGEEDDMTDLSAPMAPVLEGSGEGVTREVAEAKDAHDAKDATDATKVVPSLVIDKPDSSSKPTKSSSLDSYKVDIRRPGKRN